MAIAIVGAGGHGRVALEALRSRDSSIEAYFVDDDPQKIGRVLIEARVEGPLSRLSMLAHESVFVAIGNNATRARLFSTLLSRHEVVVSALHKSIWLSPSARIGQGLAIFAGAVINAGADIGNDVVVNTAATIDHDCVVEDHAHVGPGVRLTGACRIGRMAFIAAGAVVAPGCYIGEGAIVGAGSTVLSDIDPGLLAVGSPARIVRRVRDGEA